MSMSLTCGKQFFNNQRHCVWGRACAPSKRCVVTLLHLFHQVTTLEIRICPSLCTRNNDCVSDITYYYQILLKELAKVRLSGKLIGNTKMSRSSKRHCSGFWL